MTKPKIFAELSFDDAKQRSVAEKKLLVVDFAAEWCGPCQAMDRETWSDATLVEWLAPRAIAIQIDVDKQPAISGALGIRAMPTIVVFKDGAELDRSTGARRTAGLIAWLDDLEKGITALDRLRLEAKDDPLARGRLARRLIEMGKRDEAVALRDAAAPVDGADLDAATLQDWIIFNDALNENAATLAWFERVKNDVWPARDERVARVIDDFVGGMLVEERRFADAGALVVNPLDVLARGIETVAAATDERARAWFRDAVQRRTAMTVKTLRAAGRKDEASALEAKGRELDPSEEMAAALSKAKVVSRWDE
jgi:thiol-disulfide isomerase/thioredoxin